MWIPKFRTPNAQSAIEFPKKTTGGSLTFFFLHIWFFFEVDGFCWVSTLPNQLGFFSNSSEGRRSWHFVFPELRRMEPAPRRRDASERCGRGAVAMQPMAAPAKPGEQRHICRHTTPRILTFFQHSPKIVIQLYHVVSNSIITAAFSIVESLPLSLGHRIAVPQELQAGHQQRHVAQPPAARKRGQQRQQRRQNAQRTLLEGQGGKLYGMER